MSLKQIRNALATEIREVRAALRRQIHDDEAAGEAWDGLKGDSAAEAAAMEGIRELDRGTTASINNTYLKTQITTGLMIALLAVFVTIFGQLNRVIGSLLVAGVIMQGLSIFISHMVTTPERSSWKQVVETPALIVLGTTARNRFIAASKQAFRKRAKLLKNRRIAWLATWLLNMPGFVLTMLAWSWMGTSIALAAIALFVWQYKKLISQPAPTQPK